MNRFLKILFWTLTVSVMCLIFYFSSQVAVESSQMSRGVIFRLLDSFYPGFNKLSPEAQVGLEESLTFIVRKSAHFLIYAALGVFSMSAACCYRSNMKIRFFASLALCTVYAISDEIHQLFVEGRSCEIRDVFIDSMGSALGILLVMITVNIYIKKRKVGRHKC